MKLMGKIRQLLLNSVNQFPCKSSLSYCQLKQSYLKIVPILNKQKLQLELNQISINWMQTRQLATDLNFERISNRLSFAKMKSFFEENSLEFKVGHTCLHVNCPFCNLDFDADPIPKILYVNKVTGMFICFVCKRTGPWHVLKEFVTSVTQMKTINKDFQKPDSNPNFFVKESDRDAFKIRFKEATPLKYLSKKQFALIEEKFKLKCLIQRKIENYNIKVSQDRNEILFPLFDINKEICGLQVLTIPDLKEETNHTYKLFPLEKDYFVRGLFLSQLENTKEVVLTVTPLDAIAVTQETNKTAISLPSMMNLLPIEILPQFEIYDKITIWFGNSLKCWEAAKTFARKLGEKRCYFIKTSEDIPASSVCLQRGLNLNSILNEAQPVIHKSITTFHSMRRHIFNELYDIEQVSGFKWARFPGLNKLLKGHRAGELTILSGPTGSGKTTLISEYSLDLCMQGAAS